MRQWAPLRHSLAALLVLVFLMPAISAHAAASPAKRPKLDARVREQASKAGWSRVIVRAAHGSSLSKVAPLIVRAGGKVGRTLPLIEARVADVPNSALAALADHALVEQVSLDRPVVGVVDRTAATIGATAVRQELGYDGAGIGVAVIDSGVTAWHDDLTGGTAQRISRFVDFVNGGTVAFDDFGHGTHVAGVIAGNGFDSGGLRSGVAPAADLIVLKVLDGSGIGHASDVIAALDYVVANKDALNIRVVNLSIAAAVHESYDSDPLTLAAKRAVSAGIVVVAAAGNFGHDPQGDAQYGGVTAPGNAPWVVTVGASSHMGTAARRDDTIARFSSRGPTAVDRGAKPDLVAPGVGVESLSDPASAFYTSKSAYLLSGSVSTAYLPYLSLSGTSVAAPVVSGTVALMLQANPALTPNAVKAILQYTAQPYPGYDVLTQGAGFLNAQGAVKLARFFASGAGTAYPSASGWGRQLIWGNQRIRGGQLTRNANAWATDVTWGAALTASGRNVEWGTLCAAGGCETGGSAIATWEAECSDAACTTVAWGAGDASNVVWGNVCGGADCNASWSVNLVGGEPVDTNTADTIVWGSDDAETIVWGSNGEETIVWGSDGGDTIVWGSSCKDSSCDVVWKTNEQ
jgi:serine protease AprX